MEKTEFNCKGNNAPAYSCNKPGDNSGTYYQAADVDGMIEEIKGANCLGEIAKILRRFGIQ